MRSELKSVTGLHNRSIFTSFFADRRCSSFHGINYLIDRCQFFASDTCDIYAMQIQDLLRQQQLCEILSICLFGATSLSRQMAFLGDNCLTSEYICWDGQQQSSRQYFVMHSSTSQEYLHTWFTFFAVTFKEAFLQAHLINLHCWMQGCSIATLIMNTAPLAIILLMCTCGDVKCTIWRYDGAVCSPC